MLKAYKYKIKPTEDQKILLNKHFGSIRFVYNYFLNERKEYYQENNKSLSYQDNSKSLTELKTLKEYEWLRDINAQSLQQSLKCLEASYNNFFKKISKFPRFKSKRGKNSFTAPQYVKVKKDILYLPKFREGIKMIKHRAFTGNIRKCILSKTPTNEYFVSILVEVSHKKEPKTNKQIGIDLGLKDFVITSDGKKYKNNKYTKKYERKLSKAQKHLSRKTKGSNRYLKQKLKVAKIHKKITNSRMDRLHKVSTDLIRKYDTIVIEDLNVKGMVKNHKLAKHISDASWGKFVELLTYKSEWNDRNLIKVGRFFPSSKTCNECGFINQDLKLNMREWKCPKCKSVLDRDLNASINILKEGLRI